MIQNKLVHKISFQILQRTVFNTLNQLKEKKTIREIIIIHHYFTILLYILLFHLRIIICDAKILRLTQVLSERLHTTSSSAESSSINWLTDIGT